MFGATPPPQDEETPFYPRSPYGAAKVYAYWMTRNYREALRPVRRQRHPVQPRVAAARRDVRDPQDHPRGGADPGRARGARSTSATSTPSATGATRRSTSRACGGCCRPTSRTTTCSRRAATSPSATSCVTAFEHVGLDWEKHVRFDERYLRPTEVDALIGDAGKAERRAGLEGDRRHRAARPDHGRRRHRDARARGQALDRPASARGLAGARVVMTTGAPTGRPLDPASTIYVAGHRGLVGSAIVRAPRAGRVRRHRGPYARPSST